jgi:hypothetical protein
MAKEINIARLSVDMIANTATYRSQLADLIKQTDKRLKELEKINSGSNKKINSDDAKSGKESARIAKKIADMEVEAYAEGARRTAAIRRTTEQAAQKSARRTSSYFTQAGFQIQDSLVQAQGGIAATTIVAQQGSQFLGAFGAAGALAGAALAGVAVAVGISEPRHPLMFNTECVVWPSARRLASLRQARAVGQ